MENKIRLTWFVIARMIVVTLFLAGTFFMNIREPASLGEQALSSFVRLFVATYIFCIVSLFLIKVVDRHIRVITYVQIIWDLIFVTLLLLMTGGINSPFSFLYLLSIINASVLLARREAFYTASLCSILYGAMVNLLYYGYLTPFKTEYLPPLQYDTRYSFYITFLNITAFYLVAFLTGTLAEQARRSESALLDKTVDLEELERLHSSIVSNLSSGLLTINREGRIRVFNQYAEKLTGINQAEAYDMPLHEVLPGFGDLFKEQHLINRGEFRCRTVSGEPRILGFNSVPLFDKAGEMEGYLINFQDLTRIKKMEEDLKRADRLAAVGELSASIAHEIRNPLASISGSVQLIANGDSVAEKDRKLLDIVVRETARLNDLIRDFLAYARPVKPVKMKIQVKRFLSDLHSQLTTDTRFDGIQFDFNAPENLCVFVDTDQFKQVFWNLLINSAEAMKGSGTIAIEAFPHTGELDMEDDDLVKIVIADTGSGMNAEQLGRLFEPFYTTKTQGTGLGLATVYRIVEAHGGKIDVSSIKDTGTVFTIVLPGCEKEFNAKGESKWI
jgi:two-component system sensor histidine kinase PilS (NtrC family)